MDRILQAVPTLADLIRSGGCECSVSEVRRMEKVILDRFQWDLTRATAIDFLHAVSILVQFQTDSQLFALSTGHYVHLTTLEHQIIN